MADETKYGTIEHDLKCPICDEKLDVSVKIQVSDAVVQHTGTKAMRKMFNTHISSEVLGCLIEHDCIYTPPK